MREAFRCDPSHRLIVDLIYILTDEITVTSAVHHMVCNSAYGTTPLRPFPGLSVFKTQGENSSHKSQHLIVLKIALKVLYEHLACQTLFFISKKIKS